MKRFLIALTSLALIGCGSSTQLAGEAAPVQSSREITGRVVLDGPWAGAEVVALRPDGTVLQTATTDGAGRFSLRVGDGAGPIRLVASGQPPGAPGPESYAADYDSADPTHDLFVNPLTNLLAAYRDEHPEVPTAQARERIRTYFGMTGHEQLETHMVKRGLRPGFPVRRYLSQARASVAHRGEGGTPYVKSLVGEIHAGGSTGAKRGLSNSQTTWESAIAVTGTATLQLIVGLEAGNIYAGPAAALSGWVLGSLLGLNNPNAAILQELAEIVNLLNQVVLELTALQQELQQVQIQALEIRLGKDTNAISAVVQGFTASNLTNGSTSQAAATSVAQLALEGATSTETGLPLRMTDINSTLVPGPGGDYLRLAAANLTSTLPIPGIQITGSMYNNQNWYNPLAGLFGYYASYQSQAAQMLVEGFHSLPVPNMSSAVYYFDLFCRQVALQRSLTPRPFDSDDVIYHPTSGLIFYSVIQPPATYWVARGHASRFREGGYRNWRIMTLSDVNNWIVGGLPGDGPNAGNGNSGISLEDLQTMGFDTTNVGLTGSQPWFGVDDDGNVGPEAWYLGSGGSPGQGGNGPQPWGIIWDNVLHYPYILVCDAASQSPELIPALGNLTSLSVSSSPLPGGAQLSATGNFTLNLADQATYKSSPTTVTGPDLTSLVSWSCDALAAARVQNYPSGSASPPAFASPPAGYSGPFGPGVVTFYSPSNGTTVNVTGTYQTMSLSQNLTVSAPPPVLQAVWISPQSYIFNSASTVLNVTATGYYSDGTTQDLSTGSTTTWNVVPPAAGNVVVIDGVAQLSVAPGSRGVSNFTLSAAVGNQTGTTTVYVNIP